MRSLETVVKLEKNVMRKHPHKNPVNIAFYQDNCKKMNYQMIFLLLLLNTYSHLPFFGQYVDFYFSLLTNYSEKDKITTMVLVQMMNAEKIMVLCDTLTNEPSGSLTRYFERSIAAKPRIEHVTQSFFKVSRGSINK